MTPSLTHIGNQASPILVIDAFDGDLPALIDTAAGLAPFPRAERVLYPGLRRPLRRDDAAAWAYVERTVHRVAPFVGRAFGIGAFDLLEASFSIVTDPPQALSPLQRIPHFDAADPGFLAILHYLGGTEATGTAFYRQRATGIERVDAGNQAAFEAAVRAAAAKSTGYVDGANDSDNHFERIAFVPAAPDRLVVYQGALLHSGVIPPGMAFSPDPRLGRLTANLFVLATR